MKIFRSVIHQSKDQKATGCYNVTLVTLKRNAVDCEDEKEL